MSDERNVMSAEGTGERKYFAKPKFCQFCADKQLIIDYKKTDLLSKYVTEEGKIRPRRQTGACARHQRLVAAAVKQARHLALLPFSGRHTEDRSLSSYEPFGAWAGSMPRVYVNPDMELKKIRVKEKKMSKETGRKPVLHTK